MDNNPKDNRNQPPPHAPGKGTDKPHRDNPQDPRNS
jgi:hypothetical protein